MKATKLYLDIYTVHTYTVYEVACEKYYSFNG